MADLDKACDYWVSIYLRVFRMGWLNFPSDLEALPVEQKCGILRGMMVDAGKSGLLPSLEQVLDIMATACAGAPSQPPAPEVAPAKPVEAPKPTEPGQQTLAEAPESIPSPGTKPTAQGPRMATQNQIDAIRKFCTVPKLKGFVAETLRTKKLGNAQDLTFDEAFELVGKLHDMKTSHIPPGAKVDTTGAKT